MESPSLADRDADDGGDADCLELASVLHRELALGRAHDEGLSCTGYASCPKNVSSSGHDALSGGVSGICSNCLSKYIRKCECRKCVVTVDTGHIGDDCHQCEERKAPLGKDYLSGALSTFRVFEVQLIIYIYIILWYMWLWCRNDCHSYLQCFRLLEIV